VFVLFEETTCHAHPSKSKSHNLPALNIPSKFKHSSSHKYQSIATNRARAARDLPLGLGEETRGREERILSLCSSIIYVEFRM
jgi:hypothetical protein